MRVKNLFSFLPIVSSAQVVWHRITFSRLTILYFLFSVSHCITQVLFQGQAFQINAAAANLFNAILVAANAKVTGFAFLESNVENGNMTLYWCKGMPVGDSYMSGCRVLWGNGHSGDAVGGYTMGAGASTGGAFTNPNGVSILGMTTATGTGTATIDSINAIATDSVSAGQVVTVPSQQQQTQTAVVQSPTGIPSSNNLHSEGESALGDLISSFQPRSPPHDPYFRDSPNPLGPPKGIYSSLDKRSNIVDPSNPPSTVLATTTSDNGTSITISNLPNAPPTLVLTQQCLLALNWPLETLQNTKREDIVFINFHVWVLGMSVVALLNESIPHMLASLVTHIMLTAWSVFQLLQTRSFQSSFKSIILDLCNDQNLLPTYWKDRATAEIPSAAFSGAALLVSAWLSWRLFKTYNWATFKRIGASRRISRVYKIVLSLSVTLQLSIFFIVVSMALWIDQLCNGAIGLTSTHMTLYRATYITILILLLPWIVTGWKAVRREHRLLMAGFLIFNVLLIGGWASMFASVTFRWTFVQWRFFGIMSVSAVVLSLGTLVLGIWCRRNFGSELWKYLDSKERLADDEEFASSSANYPNSMYYENSPHTPYMDEKRLSYPEEKVSFPSPGPVPTFGSAFGSNPPSRNASSNTTSSNFSQKSVTAQYVNYPTTRVPPPAAVGTEERRISVGSAHSVRTIDEPIDVPRRSGSSGGSSARGQGRGGGARLQKKWVLE